MTSTEKTVHLVPSFHYDIEYLLTEGAYLEICFQNLIMAHELLLKYPHYTFRVEQVYLLEHFFREYPNLLDDFRRFAKEGRLEVAAGMYAMADINMPAGESILRQLTTGKKWCREILGLTPRVLDMGDCTGHPAQMPQIARTCGYDYFVFERAVDDVHRKCEIRWRGINGTEIPTYWLPDGYVGWNRWISCKDDDLKDLANLMERLDRHCLSKQRVVAHGGDFRPPYERGIAAVATWNATHSTKIVYSTYARGFDAVDFSSAPLETGEWNPDRQGCYSSRIRIKQGNRECESLILTAEAICALASRLWSTPPDRTGLARAWKMIFVNQFHDIIWGTICDDAYGHALERMGRIRMICKNIIEDRLRVVAPAQTGDQRKAVVFNPLPWERKFQLDLPVEKSADGIEITGPDGKTIMSRSCENRIIAPVTLPACGYSLFTIHRKTAETNAVKPAIAPADCPPFKTNFAQTEGGTELEIETPVYHVRFGAGGVIRSLDDKRSGLQYVDQELSAFNALCYQTDRGDLWQYYDGPLHDGGEMGLARDLPADPYPLGYRLTNNGRRIFLDAIDNRNGPAAEFSIEEISRDRLIVRIKGKISRKFPCFREFYKEGIRIEWEQKVIFYADDRQIDFYLATHHASGQWYRLRAAFFTGIKKGIICHEIPFGSFNRPEGEFAAQNYVAYYDDHKGLALINRGLPGNNVTGGVMMLSLMRSVSIHTRAESDKAFEMGEHHRFEYVIVPFAGRKELNDMQLAKRGMEFVHQPYVFDTASNLPAGPCASPADRSKPCPPTGSLLALQSNSVLCSSVYPEDDRLIIRLWETQGQDAEATLTFSPLIKHAAETNAIFEGRVNLEFHGNNLKLAFKPFEIKTLNLS